MDDDWDGSGRGARLWKSEPLYQQAQAERTVFFLPHLGQSPHGASSQGPEQDVREATGKGCSHGGSASRRGRGPSWWRMHRHGLYTDPWGCDCGDSSLLPASWAPCLQPEGGFLEEKPQVFSCAPSPWESTDSKLQLSDRKLLLKKYVWDPKWVPTKKTLEQNHS